jgi:hypothetical protein
MSEVLQPMNSSSQQAFYTESINLLYLPYVGVLLAQLLGCDFHLTHSFCLLEEYFSAISSTKILVLHVDIDVSELLVYVIF